MIVITVWIVTIKLGETEENSFITPMNWEVIWCVQGLFFLIEQIQERGKEE